MSEPRRWISALVIVAVVVVGVGIAAVVGRTDSSNSTAHEATSSTRASATTERGPGASTTTTVPDTPTTVGRPTDQRTMTKFATIGGTISPKSVMASGRGEVTAQNMMYTHTITVYRSDGVLERTIPDSVDLAALGHPEHVGTFRGAPVEASFTPDGRYEYVTNYSMYGPGFGPEGTDKCSPASGYDHSFVYRLDTRTWKVDQAIEVGSVPKYVKVTPDGRTVLVTNWCSYTLSFIDVASAREVATLRLGAYPRGIVVTADSKTAYVAVMGTTTIAKVDLHTHTFSTFAAGGQGPRHVVLSPDGRYLYATLNGAGVVTKIATDTDRVVATVHTGVNPRSMDISTDGRSLYVVNYGSDTVTKLRTDTMTELQRIATSHHPIGITYDGATGRIWVACYVGVISVFDDK